MAERGYKKYMKKGAKKDYSLLQLFVISFFGMLLIFTVLIKSFSPSVDVSIGDYKQEPDLEEKSVIVDNRLTAIQEEDAGRSFSDMMAHPQDVVPESPAAEKESKTMWQRQEETAQAIETVQKPAEEPLYKVFIGSYTSAEQAKVVKDIVQEGNLDLNPMVKCIGSNNYTLQVGIFKNKSSAEALLYKIQQNHLPGRIVQEN